MRRFRSSWSTMVRWQVRNGSASSGIRSTSKGGGHIKRGRAASRRGRSVPLSGTSGFRTRACRTVGECRTGCGHPLPGPTATVVPVSNHPPVKVLGLGREHRVDVPIGMTACGCAASVGRDVIQVVGPWEKTGFREVAHSGREHEPGACGAGLDRAVKAPEEVAARSRDLRFRKYVRNRLAVFIDRHRNGTARHSLQTARASGPPCPSRLRNFGPAAHGHATSPVPLRGDGRVCCPHRAGHEGRWTWGGRQ